MHTQIRAFTPITPITPIRTDTTPTVLQRRHFIRRATAIGRRVVARADITAGAVAFVVRAGADAALPFGEGIGAVVGGGEGEGEEGGQGGCGEGKETHCSGFGEGG